MTAFALIEHPAVSRQRLRQKLERAIDKLILTLDALDGDPDLEDGADDEPSLGAPIPSTDWRGSQAFWSGGNDNDLEEQCEDEGGEHDGREPEEYE